MVSTYRFDEAVLRDQVEELVEEHRSTVARLDLVARAVVARRAGRTAAGAVGIVGGLVMLGAAAWHALADPHGWFFGGRSHGGMLTTLLGGTWCAMLVAYVLGRLGAHVLLGRALGRAPKLTGHPRVDLARLRRADPQRDVTGLLDRLAARSHGWPLAAMGLLLPLTLHFLFWELFFEQGRLDHWHQFDEWIQMSAVCVGLAHLVLAALCVRFGKRLVAQPDPMHTPGPIAEGFKAVLLTTLAGCLPGAVLFLIPPALTFFTGALFIPLAFYGTAKEVAAERAALASLEA